MVELSKIFLEWPAIVQGGLGSGLFWLILIIGRKSIGCFVNIYSQFSSKVQIHKLTDLRFRCIYFKVLLSKVNNEKKIVRVY